MAALCLLHDDDEAGVVQLGRYTLSLSPDRP